MESSRDVIITFMSYDMDGMRAWFRLRLDIDRGGMSYSKLHQ